MNSKDYFEDIKSFIETGRSNDSRKIAHQTWYVKTTDAFDAIVYGIQYHNTVIAGIKEDGSYFINNGGWFSATTKKRINEFFRKIGWDSVISQRSYQWYFCSVHFSGTALFDWTNTQLDNSIIDCFAYPINTNGV
jgi:hypothetical protein